MMHESDKSSGKKQKQSMWQGACKSALWKVQGLMVELSRGLPCWYSYPVLASITRTREEKTEGQTLQHARLQTLIPEQERTAKGKRRD